MTENRDSLSDRFASVPFGTEKTAEDWVSTAGWWINELGDALPDAAPMFKALVDVLKECQRRGGERDRLRAENERLRKTMDYISVLNDAISPSRVNWYETAQIMREKARTALSSDETGARPHDAEGRPLCFVCRRTQSEHEGGVECSAPSPRD